MLNMKKLLTKVLKGDFVIEEGTTGIWTYRKWNSGIAECWGGETKTTAINTQWGSGYISGVLTTTFPSGLFTETPTYTMSTRGGTQAMLTNASGTDASAVNYLLVRLQTSPSNAYFINVYAIGKWK